MNRKESFVKYSLVLFVIFAVGMTVSVSASAFSTSASALPPSEKIICKGCTLIQESVNMFSSWVKEGKTITLIGPAGYQSYVWTGGGQTTSGQSFSAKIVSDTVYTLTLNGNKVKTVQINLVSSLCENLVMSGITIDTTSLTVGQRIAISVDFDESKCPKAVRSWTVEGSGLLVENPSAERTWLRVISKPADGKNPILRFRAVSGVQEREVEVMLIIGDNNKPTIKSLSTTPVTALSHHETVINCDKCFSGKEQNEESDYLSEFSVRVKSLNGTFNKVFNRTFDRNNGNFVSVSAGTLEEGFYLVEARIKDSRNAYSETFFDKIFVSFGNTEFDAPHIKLKPVVCTGTVCSLDTSETVSNSLGLSRRYYRRTVSGYEPIYNVNGNLCASDICRATLSGGDEVKITIQYMRNGKPNGKIAEKIVNLCAGCVNSSNTQTVAAVSDKTPIAQTTTPHQTVTPTVIQVPQPTTTPKCGEDGYGCATPSLGGFAVVTIVFLARRIQKRNKK